MLAGRRGWRPGHPTDRPQTAAAASVGRSLGPCRLPAARLPLLVRPRSLIPPPPPPPARLPFASPALLQYQTLGRIGEGTYGVVFKAKDKASQRVLALKQIRCAHGARAHPASCAAAAAPSS